MKKTILFLLMLGVTYFASAQDIKKAKKAFENKDINGARASIDIAMNEPKFQKEWSNWFLKGDIYTALSDDAAHADSASPLRMMAYEAYKKGIEMDPKNAAMLFELARTNNQQISNLFSKEIDFANQSLDANKFDISIAAYKNSMTLGLYMLEKQWAAGPMDTAMKATIPFYIGYSSLKAKNDEESLKYFTMLINSGITNNKDYLIGYEWVADYYAKKNDYDNFKLIADKGRKAYPAEKYFDSAELELLEKLGRSEEALKKQEDMLNANPNDYDGHYYFGNILFNKLFSSEKNQPTKMNSL